MSAISATRSYERANALAPDCVDEQIPHNWVVDNVIVHKDLSVACAFRVDFPPFFTMDAAGQEAVWRGICGFLNTLDVKFDVQLHWQTHRQVDDIIDAITSLTPKNRTMQEYQAEMVSRIRDSAASSRLKRYRAYVTLVHPPLLNSGALKQRARDEIKERKANGVWSEPYGMGNFFQELFTTKPPPWSMQYEEGEHDGEFTKVKDALFTSAAVLENMLAQLGMAPQFLKNQDLVDVMFEFWNPTLAEQGVKCGRLNDEPQPITDYICQSEVSMDRRNGYLYMDNAVHRILTLRTPPSEMVLNRFDQALDQPYVKNLRITCNIQNYSREKRILDLQNRLPLLEARVEKDRRLLVTVEQINREILRLQRGDESCWAMTTVFHTWGKTEGEVDGYALELKRLGKQSGNGTIVQEEHALWAYWLAAQPFWTRDDDIHRRHIFSASQAACMLPISGHPELIVGEVPAVILETANGSLFNFNPMDGTRLNNYNTIVLGSPGTGKSFLTGTILMGMQPQGARVIAIDLGGSYRPLCEVLNGSYITMDPNSTAQTINPLQVAPGQEITPVERNQITMWLEKACLDPAEVMGKRRATYIDEVLTQLFANQKGEVFLTNLRDKLQSYGKPETQDMADRLGQYCRGGKYGNLYDGKTKLDFHNPFVVFDLTDVKDNKDIAPLTIMSILNNVRQMTYSYPKEPKILLMDEAWFLLQEPVTSKFIAECFRTYRKLNVGIMGVSQGINEWAGGGSSSEILNNVSNFIFLGAANPKSVLDAQALLGLTDEEVQIVTELKTVRGDYSQALLVQKRSAGRFSTVVLNRSSPLQYAIMTTHGADKREIELIREELGCTHLEARMAFAKRHPKGVAASK